MSAGLVKKGPWSLQIAERLRPSTWAGLALYFVLAFGGVTQPELGLLRLVWVFFLFLALRVFDDLLCTRYEVKSGPSRFYHDTQGATVYGRWGAGFALVVILLFAKVQVGAAVFSVLLSLSALGYLLTRETVYVKWVSGLKYPFLVLMLSPLPSLVGLLFAAMIGALFMIGEAVEEKILKGVYWRWVLPFGALFLLLISIGSELYFGGLHVV